ncbi:MAG: GntR family transcriptional regulator, partial [Vulcanimicrobiaceae bacterium]
PLHRNMKQFHTKSAYAASVIRRALSDGVYGAGERLTTARLAKELGLSMTPVREALIELANEGLVEISPHRGARVAELGLVDLSDVYLARAILEPAATRLAARRLDTNTIADIRKIHQDFLAAVDQGDADTLLALNESFHFAIYDLAMSPLLRRLIRVVWSASPNDTFRLIPGRAEQSLKDHTAIMRALTSGNAERAEKAMQNHINASLHLITNFKKKRSPGGG